MSSFALVAFVPTPSRAEGGPRAELLAAAERAARLGEYGFAIAAFDQAYRARPESTLLFDLARTYQRRFTLTREADDRRAAIARYRAYLDVAARGTLADRARRALAELEKEAAAEPPCDVPPCAPAVGPPTAEPGEQRPVTWLAVLSPVMGAEARIDGDEGRTLPLFTTIGAGQHTVEVRAVGYRKQTKKLGAARGLVHVVTVDLSPEPAKLTIDGTGGAELHVDGQFAGLVPIEEPIELPAGTRRLAVTLNGYRPYVDEVQLGPGSSTALEVDLDMTRRRVGSSVLLALGAAGVITGLVFGAASVAVDGSVADEPDSPDKSRDLARADGYRAVSGMAAGVGLGLSLSGAILFTFDEPELGPEPSGGALGGLGLRGRF